MNFARFVLFGVLSAATNNTAYFMRHFAKLGPQWFVLQGSDGFSLFGSQLACAPASTYLIQHYGDALATFDVNASGSEWTQVFIFNKDRMDAETVSRCIEIKGNLLFANSEWARQLRIFQLEFANQAFEEMRSVIGEDLFHDIRDAIFSCQGNAYEEGDRYRNCGQLLSRASSSGIACTLLLMPLVNFFLLQFTQ